MCFPPNSCSYYKYLTELPRRSRSLLQPKVQRGTQFTCPSCPSSAPLDVLSAWRLETSERRKEAVAAVPVLKMRSHAAVWSRQILVLSLLWMCTGVTIITPNVLIIYAGRNSSLGAKPSLTHRFKPVCSWTHWPVGPSWPRSYRLLICWYSMCRSEWTWWTVSVSHIITNVLSCCTKEQRQHRHSPFSRPWWSSWLPRWPSLAADRTSCRTAPGKWLIDGDEPRLESASVQCPNKSTGLTLEGPFVQLEVQISNLPLVVRLYDSGHEVGQNLSWT